MGSDELQPQFLELPQQTSMAGSSSLSNAGEQISSSERERRDDILEAQLAKWIEAACRKSPERRRTGQMGRDFNCIYRNRKWWCYYNSGNRDYYEQALYVMWWEYFWRYLCVCNPDIYNRDTQTKSFYETLFEPHPNPVISRLLLRLKGALIDEYRKRKRNNDKLKQVTGDPDIYFGKMPTPTSALPNAYDRILRYLELDPNGELEAIQVGRQPKGRMRLYLKWRFEEPELSITKIAEKMHIPNPTIQDKRWKSVAQKWERELTERAARGEL